jgi:DNA-binding Lrp family transcriptional regulator
MCFQFIARSPFIAQDSFVFDSQIAMTARLDGIDHKILDIVQHEGRISNVDLAARIHLSAPQAFRRVRSLEERGVIRGYRGEVAPEAIGFAVTAYVSVSIGGDDFGRVREIEAEIRAFPQILECYSVSGEDDYLLKVVAHDLKSLSNFLTDRLMQVPGIDDVRSMICLEEIKPASPLPVSP